MKCGHRLIADERRRQEWIGWNTEHDDDHDAQELLAAAQSYIWSAMRQKAKAKRAWPWDWDDFKPKDARSDLVRAGALIAAELDRMNRAEKENP